MGARWLEEQVGKEMLSSVCLLRGRVLGMDMSQGLQRQIQETSAWRLKFIPRLPTDGVLVCTEDKAKRLEV